MFWFDCLVRLTVLGRGTAVELPLLFDLGKGGFVLATAGKLGGCHLSAICLSADGCSGESGVVGVLDAVRAAVPVASSCLKAEFNANVLVLFAEIDVFEGAGAAAAAVDGS